MRWIKQDKAKFDGRYLAYLKEEDSMAFVVLKDRMWYTQTPKGMVPLGGIRFDSVCRLMRPTK